MVTHERTREAPACNAARRSAPGALRRRDAVYLALTLVAFILIVVLWDARWRHNQPFDIDESGYLTFALQDLHVLQSGGPLSWVQQVDAPSIQSPLTTALATPFFLVFGASTLSALLVPLCLMVTAIGFTFALARRVTSRIAAWLCIAAVATTPAIINYARVFNFTAAATAAVAFALYAYHRSERLQNLRWSCLFGIALGVLPLARTMTASFIPAFLVLGLLAVWQSKRRSVCVRNALLATILGVAVASVWLLPHRNYARVWQYLTSYGYGSASASFGQSHSLLSYQAWNQSWRTFLSVAYVPHVLLYLLGAILALLAGAFVIKDVGWRHGLARVERHPLFPSSVLVLEGFAALSSSGNTGDGFSIPLVVPLSIITGWSLNRWLRSAPHVSAALVAMLGVIAVVPLLPWSKSLSGTWRATLPVLGRETIASGQGEMQALEERSFGTTGNLLNNHAAALGRAWMAANRSTAERVGTLAGTSKLVTLDFEGYLLNSNSLNFVRALANQPLLQINEIVTEQVGATRAGLVRWLTKAGGASACIALSVSGVQDDVTRLDPALVAAAQRQVGFVPTSRWRLPDGETLTAWRRPSACGSAPSD